MLDERKTIESLSAQVHQRWAWRIGGVAALLLSGAESPSRSASVRQHGGAGSRRGPLSEAVNAQTGNIEQRVVSAKNLSLIKEKLKCVLFFLSFFITGWDLP